MKLHFLHHILKTVALWVLSALGHEPVMLPARAIELKRDVRGFMKELDPSALPSDGKRQAVYARAIKLHPNDQTWHIALAIELVMVDWKTGVPDDPAEEPHFP